MDKMEGKNRTCKRKRRRVFTDGELNRLVDGFFHPLAKRNRWFFIVDGLFHGLIERDPHKTLRKFMRYNLADFLKERDEKK